jgi:site-specific recombinase XerD
MGETAVVSEPGSIEKRVRPWSGRNLDFEGTLARRCSDLNREAVREFLDHLRAKKRSPGTAMAYLQYLAKWDQWMAARGKRINRLEDITRKDMERFIVEVRREDGGELDERTQVNIIMKVKTYLEYTFQEEFLKDRALHDRLLKDLVPKLEWDSPTTEDLLTQEEVNRMIEAADHLRDKAVIATMYESGLRAEEFRTLHIRDVYFTARGTAKIILPREHNGQRLRHKTGEREVYLLHSVPHLQQWLRVHPNREGGPNPNVDAPLWPPMKHNGHHDLPIGDKILRLLVKRLAARAGIKKRVHPHLFRHSQATEWARAKLPESYMKVQFGWGRTSQMPSHYIHLAGTDVEDAILERAGRKKREERKVKPMSIQCQYCGVTNPHDARFCTACTRPVSLEVELEIVRKERLTHTSLTNRVTKVFTDLLASVDEQTRTKLLKELTA